MTRQDYQIIARAMQVSRTNYSALRPSNLLANLQEQQLVCETNLVAVLVADNPRFSPVEFLAACRKPLA